MVWPAMTRIELCTDHLDIAQREAILDALYAELHISPGQVTADGEVELDLLNCGGIEPSDSPALRVNGALFVRLTPQRVLDIVRARRRR
jgi:NADH:ubiquinone oxidoreductase subunit E